MKNTYTVIKNAHVVLENGIIFDGVILIKDGKICGFGPAWEMEIPSGAECIDAEGAYVGPGFVDIHVHGGGGASTCADPARAAAHFLRHGTTSLLSTTDYHMTFDRIMDSVRTIREAMKDTKMIKGIYMEGPYTNPIYGSHADQNPWHGAIDPEQSHAMVDACGTDVLVWTIAPERAGIADFMTYARAVNPSVRFAVGHSEAMPSEIRALGSALAPTIMTHTFDATGRRPVPGGTRGYGPDEYCMQTPDMYAELISDSCGIHVHPDLQRMLLHAKGAERVILITDSTVHNNPTPAHLAHVTDLNFDHNGGIAGSKMTMDLACRNIMSSTNCGIAQAFLMASTNPARAVGLDSEIGSVAIGKTADLIFVDDLFRVKRVMLGGKLCDI